MDAEIVTIYREEDNEKIGRIRKVSENVWQPETIFGCSIGKASSKELATEHIEKIGMDCLIDVWEIFDSEIQDWFSCKLNEINENKVSAIITDFGHKRVYEIVNVNPPFANTLRWSKLSLTTASS